MPKKFLLGKAPFVRAVDEGKISTTRMMYDVLIALAPIIIFAWVKNGLIPFIKTPNVSVLMMLWPLLFVLIGALSSVLFEAIYFALFKKVNNFKELVKTVNISYAIIPGVLLALILPLYTPIWILMLGCFLANIIFKMLFGGFGHNIFNPALIAYAFIMLAFAGTLGNAYFNPYEQTQVLSNVASVTPLSNFANLQSAGEVITSDLLVGNYGSLWNFFIGTIPGSLGETSALLCLVAFIYLAIRKTINWYVPSIYVGTVFIISLVIGFINGYDGLWYALFQVLSGGLLFGAVFMATEPVTTPKNPIGKVIFAFGLGVLTILFRFVGSFPEGVATSILFMCLFTPLIDRFASKLRANKLNWKSGLTLAGIIIVLLGIGVYSVIKCIIPKGGKVLNDAIENSTLFETTNENESISYGKPNEGHVKTDDGEVLYTVDVFNVNNETKEKTTIGCLYYVKTAGYQEDFMILVGINTSNENRIMFTGYEIVSSNETFLDKIGLNGIPFRKLVTSASLSFNNVSGATYSSKGIANAGFLARAEYYHQIGQEVPVDYQLESIAQDLSNKEDINKFNVKATYDKKPFEVVLTMTDPKDASTLKIVEASKEGLTDAEIAGIERVAKNGLKTYIYLDGDVIKGVGSGYGGSLTLKTDATYEANKVKTFVVIANSESSGTQNPPTPTAINELPNTLISSGDSFGNQNVAGATVSSNGIKAIYALVYEYVTGGAE